MWCLFKPDLLLTYSLQCVKIGHSFRILGTYTFSSGQGGGGGGVAVLLAVLLVVGGGISPEIVGN